MKLILGSGLLLGVLVAVWMCIMGYTGWYKDPTKAGLFFLVVPIQVAVLIVVLRHTAAHGRGWRAQLMAGTVVSIVAALVIFAASMLFTTVLFPNYFEELRVVQEQLMREAGMGEVEIQRQIEAAARNQTPIGYAFSGFLGTMVVGVISSAVIGIFMRAR